MCTELGCRDAPNDKQRKRRFVSTVQDRGAGSSFLPRWMDSVCRIYAPSPSSASALRLAFATLPSLLNSDDDCMIVVIEAEDIPVTGDLEDF